ncbi:MAG: hypothetical protein RSB61_04225 [Clostridia bacterium]
MIDYGYELNFDKYKLAKILLLWLCLIVDFGNLWVFVGNLVVLKWSGVLTSLGVFACLLAVRILSTFLTFKVNYRLVDSVLTVTKTAPYQRKELFCADLREIISIEKCESFAPFDSKKDIRKARNFAKIYAYTCDFDMFVLELKNSKKVLLALDEFMLANINLIVQKK